MAAGQHVGGFVCVRPEDVEVTPDRGSDQVSTPEFFAVVEAAKFLGDRLEVVVRAADLTLTVFARPRLGLRSGDKFGVRLDLGSTSYLSS